MKKLIKLLSIGLVLSLALTNTAREAIYAAPALGANLGDKTTGIIDSSNFEMKIVDPNYHGPWGLDDSIPEAQEIHNRSRVTVYGEMDFSNKSIKSGDYIDLKLPEELKHNVEKELPLTNSEVQF